MEEEYYDLGFIFSENEVEVSSTEIFTLISVSSAACPFLFFLSSPDLL